MTGPRHLRLVPALGVAGAGLLLGHWLAYALATPAATRDRVLDATGHGYLPYATQVAMLAGALGLAGVFWSRLTRRAGGGSFTRDACGFLMVQTGAYVAIEVGERLLSGAPLDDLAHGPLLAIGLGVQAVVAIAGAGLVRISERVAETVEALEGSDAPFVPPVVAVVPSSTFAPPRRRSTASAVSRAPPFPA
ncbi:MAG TPA: hypothetical protein VJ979_13210 [Actinomycetota bacterium]|nr:hypothetical protein [Actinomycetota bacterium]